MKKYLCQKGFTLIELLVVITILAILAVIGFAAFSGLTGRGNDSRREADIKSIADALEVKKGTSSTYQAITAADFATGTFPQEPDKSTARIPKYCYTDGTAAIANPAAWSQTACPTTWINSNANLAGATGITPSATAAYFKVCTVDEAKTTVICYGNRQ